MTKQIRTISCSNSVSLDMMAANTYVATSDFTISYLLYMGTLANVIYDVADKNFAILKLEN